jgi:hypothetical protein
MDIDTEIEVKQQLSVSATLAAREEDEARKHRKEAEEILANGVVWAYKLGANVATIASSLGVTRQRVYMLLALKGIRPGKEVTNA